MKIDPETLYLMLGQHVAAMPDFSGYGALTAEQNQWLGRACALVEAGGDLGDTVNMKVATQNIASVLRDGNIQAATVILHRTLSRAELMAPMSVQGGFIQAKSPFDAIMVLSKVFQTAQASVLIIDPYMDEKALTEYSVLAGTGILIQLLTDAAHVKPSLKPAAAAWVAQHGVTRPLEVRKTPARTLHDREIIIDGKTAFTLTQSLNAFAARSPASVIRIDPETSALKVAAYAQFWSAASPL